MNKINFFYTTFQGSAPASIFTGNKNNPVTLSLELIANLILDDEPKNFDILISSRNEILFKGPIPIGNIVDLGNTGLLTTQLTLPISISNVVPFQNYSFSFVLSKNGEDLQHSQTEIFIVEENNVRK